MERKSYRSDLTDKQWQLIEPHLPPEKERGRPRTTVLREVVNALLYMLRTGCQWDMLPKGFPPRTTVNDYFNAWKRDGTLDEINRVLRENIILNRPESGFATDFPDRLLSGQHDIRKMGGFFTSKPFVAVLFLIPAFSLAGIPPLSGFWAKYLIVQESLSTQHWITAATALLVGFFTLYSMIKIWRYAFWDPLISPLAEISVKKQMFSYIPVIFLAFLTLLIGILPQSCYWFIYKTANQLTQPTCYIKAVTGETLCHF